MLVETSIFLIDTIKRTSQLEWHASTSFNITNEEVLKVVDIVKIYEKERPFHLLQKK